MRLINSSNRVIVFRALIAVILLAGLTGCGFLVRPGSIKLTDPTRAVADARKLTNVDVITHPVQSEFSHSLSLDRSPDASGFRNLIDRFEG